MGPDCGCGGRCPICSLINRRLMSEHAEVIVRAVAVQGIKPKDKKKKEIDTKKK